MDRLKVLFLILWVVVLFLIGEVIGLVASFNDRDLTY